jgi:dTDP-4-dehydrorhamnose 3,5-epimerase-like enzyme
VTKDALFEEIQYSQVPDLLAIQIKTILDKRGLKNELWKNQPKLEIAKKRCQVFFFEKHNTGILSTLSVADLGKIMAVRERMDRQCEQDIVSLKASNRLVTTCRGLRRRVENLERVTRDHQGKLADLCSDTRDINKTFGKLNSLVSFN